MHIFLTGATGEIGNAVACRLVDAGHHVVALTRSESSAVKLAEQQVVPLIGNLTDLDLLESQARAADAVVHAGYTWGSNAQEVERAVTSAFLSAVAGTGKPILTTSGMAVLGPTGTNAADENMRTDPNSPLAWRAAVEQQVLQSQGCRGIVIRCSLAYGINGHRMIDVLILRAKERQAAPFIGSGNSRWSTVHLADLADLYVLALERGKAGTLFHAASGDIGMQELAECLAYRLGLNKTESWPIEEARPSLPAASQLAENMMISSVRAREQLNWNPTRPGLCTLLKAGIVRLRT